MPRAHQKLEDSAPRARSAPGRRAPASMQSSAGNRAVASLLEPRSVQRASPDDQLVGMEHGLVDAGAQALHGVEDFAREIPGVGGLIPEAGGSGMSPIGGGLGTGMAGLLESMDNPAPDLGKGLLDLGSQALHGVEDLAREIPGVGGLIPGGAKAGSLGDLVGSVMGGVAGAPARKPQHHAAAAHHHSTHSTGGSTHAAGGAHAAAAAGQHHASASHGHHAAAHPHAAKAGSAASGQAEGPGLLESMRQKSQVMQIEAAGLETASNIGQGVSDFVHEIPLVNELF